LKDRKMGQAWISGTDLLRFIGGVAEAQVLEEIASDPGRNADVRKLAEQTLSLCAREPNGDIRDVLCPVCRHHRRADARAARDRVLTAASLELHARDACGVIQGGDPARTATCRRTPTLGCRPSAAV